MHFYEKKLYIGCIFALLLVKFVVLLEEKCACACVCEKKAVTLRGKMEY